ncbi:MAG: L-lactate dehydrogenase [Coriobacteriales bacterium]|nr:L-lactate dehydrogenase [Coriobacteriales bacterium]
MKVGIVGAGLVGSTAAYALVMGGIGREIVLVDLDTKRAQAEADDLLHAVPFAHPLTVRAGDYTDLAGAAAVVVAAGVSQRPGESRADLLGRNAAVFRSVIPAILESAPDAVVVIATNPVDVMTHMADRYARDAGARVGCVFGTGTTLDTARFRALVGAHVGIDPQHVHAYVLGEHGDTEVLAWSSATVAGIPLERFCTDRGVCLVEADRTRIDQAVRGAAYRIIEGKGSTYYGVGSAISRIVDTVLAGRCSVLTVTAPTPDVLGIRDVSVSLPRLVGGTGVIETFSAQLSDAERSALAASAATVREAIDLVPA